MKPRQNQKPILHSNGGSIKKEQKPDTQTEVHLRQRRDMLEKMMQKLFKCPNPKENLQQIDIKAFLNKNYQQFVGLINKLVEMEEQKEQKKIQLEQKENQISKRVLENVSQDAEQAEQIEEQIRNLQNKIQQQQNSLSQNQKYLIQLNQCGEKKDFLTEYQQVCKTTQSLREQNNKLHLLVNKLQ